MYRENRSTGNTNQLSQVRAIVKRLVALGTHPQIFLNCLQNEHIDVTMDIAGISDPENPESTSNLVDDQSQDPSESFSNSLSRTTFNNFLGITNSELIEVIVQNHRISGTKDTPIDLALGSLKMEELGLKVSENNSFILFHLKNILVERFDLIKELSIAQPTSAEQFFNELLTIIKNATISVRATFFNGFADSGLYQQLASLFIETEKTGRDTLAAVQLELLAEFVANNPNRLPDVLAWPGGGGQMPILLTTILSFVGKVGFQKTQFTQNFFLIPQFVFIEQQWISLISSFVLPTMRQWLLDQGGSVFVSQGNQQHFWLVFTTHMSVFRDNREQLANAALQQNLFPFFDGLLPTKRGSFKTLCFLEYFTAALYWIEKLRKESLLDLDCGFRVLRRLLDSPVMKTKGLVKGLVVRCLTIIRKATTRAALEFRETIGLHIADHLVPGLEDIMLKADFSRATVNQLPTALTFSGGFQSSLAPVAQVFGSGDDWTPLCGLSCGEKTSLKVRPRDHFDINSIPSLESNQVHRNVIAVELELLDLLDQMAARKKQLGPSGPRRSLFDACFSATLQGTEPGESVPSVPDEGELK